MCSSDLNKDKIDERRRAYVESNKERVYAKNRKSNVRCGLKKEIGIANPPEALVELICIHNDLRRLIDEKRK